MNTENIFRAAGCIALASLVTFAVLTGTPAEQPQYETTPPSALETQASEVEV